MEQRLLKTFVACRGAVAANVRPSLLLLPLLLLLLPVAASHLNLQFVAA